MEPMRRRRRIRTRPRALTNQRLLSERMRRRANTSEVSLFRAIARLCMLTGYPVAVDDGEAGETTILQVRARMYYLDKTPNADNTGQVGWRERGVGNLKINVPEDSVTADPESGVVDAKSFDPSVLKESTPENPKLVRLVMRQDSTLRVILNTVMLAGMDFQIKEGFKTYSVLFTAIEGDDGQYVPITMKVRFQRISPFLRRPKRDALTNKASTDERTERGSFL